MNNSPSEVVLLSSSDDEKEEHHSQQLQWSSEESLGAQHSSDLSNSLSLEKETELAKIRRPRAAALHSISESDSDSECSLPSLDLGERLLRNRLPGCSDGLTGSVSSLLKNQSEEVQRGKIVNEVHLGNEDEACMQKAVKRPKAVGKSLRSLEKLQERERKKEEKELEKALKCIEREVKKSDKPQERVKAMRVILDSHLMKIQGSQDLFSHLDGFDFKHSIEQNHIPFSVIWHHKVTDVDIVNNKAHKVEREELENYLLLYLSKTFFTERVNAFVQKRKQSEFSHGQTLLDYVTSVKTAFPLMNLTCVIIGIEDYFREKAEDRKKKKDPQMGKTVRDGHGLKNVSRKDIEEAIIEVQLQAAVNFRFLDNISQFSDLLAMYTKAIAEAPLKRERHQQQGFSWYADADSSCPVRIARDGTGLINLWQQQICQFQNVGKEVAQAIAAEYPSPTMLLEAYRKCTTEQQAEKLLQDIVVRRGFGPLGTTRRIGPELSYKIYLFFTSSDGNLLIQR